MKKLLESIGIVFWLLMSVAFVLGSILIIVSPVIFAIAALKYLFS